MPVRLGRFEMPKRLTKEDTTATETYAKFIAEPFEPGYGHTVGNSLRRVLLSSLEGAAITSVKIDGAMHEFTTIDGVVEDVTDIVLNLKKIKFKAHTREQQTLMLSAHKEGPVTAADILLNQNVELVNPGQFVCTLDKKKKFEMEMEIKIGRGFCPGDENKKIDLSVRAANCLNNANSTTVGQLAMKTEAEMLKYRNFGKKSLNEIKEKLAALGLTLGMNIDASLLEAPKEEPKAV